MTRYRWFTVTAMMAFQLVVLAAEQKPQVIVPLPAEGRGSAASLQELWDRSDTVIEARILGSNPADYQSGDTVMVYTMYDAQVITVFKASGRVTSLTSTVKVRRPGGVRDRGSRLEKHEAAGFPQFETGSTVIMFLRQKDIIDGGKTTGFLYGTSYDGAQSFVEIRSASELRTAGRDELSREIARKNPQALRAQLRALGGLK